ncbi:FAD-dependent oxidoreductase [Roseomonas sp. E05]|uniref:flavin monoamine oxidase family protein n=1 Tax=Roseomonas sp. E05 TaxID=3046310 RepID=UPI0024BA14D7|nr:FAD-dependent oxidoreductase [Roseomonas sp. E05]MDJ0386518.1 FAD-dependent oxidoreductase [Roseomonas sp. E05]
MSDPDILVIGAGAAGIAAARAVLAAGRSVQVLEARDRPGGRAWTDTATLDAPFDLGATWLHQAGENPLTALAAKAEPFDHDAVRRHVCLLDGRRATAAEMAAYDAAYAAFHPRLEAALAAAPPEATAADYAPRGGFWDATVAHWEGPVIAAAPLAAMDLRDFLATQLGGPNLLLPGGIGALLAGLAAGLPIAYGAVAERLRWGEAGGVVAEGGFGRIAARAAIVTLPTAVLAAGGLRFEPALPAGTEQAIHDLPLGLLTKLGLRAAGDDRLDLEPFTGLERHVAREEEEAMTFIAWPFGRDHLMGFVGGGAAWALAEEGEAALADFAFAELRRAYGARADRALRREGVLASHWGTDPFARGAYSYARPGRAMARRMLAAPLAEGRLCFAGEACHPRFAGTVGGAWETGEAAARSALEALP